MEVGWHDDLWVVRSGSVGRYSLASGELLSEAVLPAGGVEDLTLGAGGTPYVASDGAVYRAGSPGQAVFARADAYVHGLVADMNGDLYVSLTNRLAWWQDPILWGEVWRIGADGTVHAAPAAASNLVAPYDLLFLIDDAGATTARLVVSNILQQARQPVLVELAAAGVPVPGMPPSGPLEISASILEDAAADVLGGTALAPVLRSWVDQIGNRNDELDVGDLAALRDWLIDNPSGTAIDRSTYGGSR